MGLYLENGYVNIKYTLSHKCPFTFLLGGRATGKTYGSILYAIENNITFAFMRRTQTQLEMLNKPELNPFIPVASDTGIPIEVVSVNRQLSNILVGEDKVNLGFMSAMSTFVNLRGFSAENTKLMIYDEFIPEVHERAIKHEDSVIFNAYESINRNRELKGNPPLQCLFLSNSNFLASPILLALKIADIIPQMRDRGQTEYINTQRGIAIYNLWDSPISEQKKETALYKATRGTSFEEMAIYNSFGADETRDIAPMSIKGCKLLGRVGDVYIYSYSGGWYISTRCSGKPRREYDYTIEDIQRFKRDNPRCWERMIKHQIRYENYYCKNIIRGMYIT